MEYLTMAEYMMFLCCRVKDWIPCSLWCSYVEKYKIYFLLWLSTWCFKIAEYVKEYTAVVQIIMFICCREQDRVPAMVEYMIFLCYRVQDWVLALVEKMIFLYCRVQDGVPCCGWVHDVPLLQSIRWSTCCGWWRWTAWRTPGSISHSTRKGGSRQIRFYIFYYEIVQN